VATRMPSKRSARIHVLPGTAIGCWAVGSAVLGIVLTMAWQFMPFGAWPGFVAQGAGGVLALVAIVRDRDWPSRSCLQCYRCCS
jgi:hypothetical protein